MKFTVVTVCFNASATIADTIASVQQQDYADVEHIVIDGASTDGTQAIVRRMANDRTLLFSEPDKGLYDAMNKGIARATGDIIGILNADDVYAHPAVLSDVARQFSAGASHDAPVDAVLGDIAFLAGGSISAPTRKLGRRYRSTRFTPARIRWGQMPAHPAMFVRKEVYARVGGYRTDFQIAADYEFVARAFGRECTSYRNLDEVLVIMRPGGLSTRNLKARWTINVETVRACRENGIRSNLMMVMTKYPHKIWDSLVNY